MSELKATLDEAPYEIRTAIARPDPARPWVWGVLISDGAFTCDDLASGKANRSVSTSTSTTDAGTETKTEVTGPADDMRLMAMFSTSAAGTTAAFVMPSGKGGADVALDVRSVIVGSVPDKAGPGGTLDVNLKGPTFELVGTVPFELCAPLGARPAIAWGTKPEKVTLSRPAYFEGDPDLTLKVLMTVPDGWDKREPRPKPDFQFDTQWSAPDGITVLSIALEDPPEDFAKEAKKRAADTLKTWKEMGAKVLRDEAVGKGAYVLSYGSATATVEVFRYEPGWTAMVHCTLVSDQPGSPIFDTAATACTDLRAP